MRENFFIFVERLRNFEISMKYLLYGANITRPEHRALANVKEGDIIFVYVMENRALYGPYVALQRLFEDSRDIGWRFGNSTADWPHRVPMRLWSASIGVIDRSKMANLITFLRNEMITLKDLSELHQRYLNTLLYDEGVRLLKFFLKHCKWEKPSDLIPDFGREAGNYLRPLDAGELLRHARNPSEYIIELYLLQNINSLESLVGRGITETYNQVYIYQKKILDILTLHKHRDEVIKATVVEIKTKDDSQTIEKGLEELGHYMYWVTDVITKDHDVTYGVLLTPFSKNPEVSTFKRKVEEIAEFYGINTERISWVGYTVANEELHFAPIAP